jgi:hypothetical protein
MITVKVFSHAQSSLAVLLRAAENAEKGNMLVTGIWRMLIFGHTLAPSAPKSIHIPAG